MDDAQLWFLLQFQGRIQNFEKGGPIEENKC